MILYLSATGNTHWAAKILSQQTGEDMKPITEFTDDVFTVRLKPEERLGICFPVHAWRPPTIVCNFIERMRVISPTPFYFYALCTAGDNIGETMTILRRHATKRGFTIDACFSLLMPESYVGLPFMDVDSIEKERKKKQKAESELQGIVENVLNRDKNIERLTLGKWPKTDSRLLGWFFYKHLISDKKFKVDRNKCIGCGKCKKSCPVSNIEYDNQRKPFWKHNSHCMTCFSCYHHCPVHAIEFGKQTKNKGQYYFERNT